MLIRIEEDGELKRNQDREQPQKVDRCSLVREEADFHKGEGLETAPDVDGEYDLLILDG